MDLVQSPKGVPTYQVSRDSRGDERVGAVDQCPANNEHN